MKYYKVFLIIIVTGIVIPFFSSKAIAHKVNIFAYSEEGLIYTEGYFPGGKKVIDGKIEVFDSKGIKLLEGVTDDQGLFDFKPPKKDDLKIELTASMGHKTFIVIKAEEIDIEYKKELPPAKAQKKKSQNKVRKRIKPPKEKNSVAILAGLGFIMGLSSLILHFTKKE